MRPLLTPALAALLLAFPAADAAGQDLLQPLEDFVQELLPPRQAPPRPAPPAAAEDEEETEPPPFPRPRPDFAAEEAAADPAPAEDDIPPPRSDPREEEAPEEEAEDAETAPAPARVYQAACPALLSGRVVGEMLPPVAEGICGERSPLSISAVNLGGRQVTLSSPVTTNCAMAGAFADWVGEVDAYAEAALDSPLATVSTGTSLMCRNRNGAAEGPVSEHGFANALDIAGFTLADGRSIAVADDWLPAAAAGGRLLRQAHGAACGRFTTVLGPEADAAHADHLHLDLGCHGRSCTARICE